MLSPDVPETSKPRFIGSRNIARSDHLMATSKKAKRLDVSYNVEEAEEEDEVAAAEAVREQRAWEKSYANDRTWEELQEDDSGRLRPAQRLAEQQREQRRQQQAAQGPLSSRVQRGIIRYVVLAMDASKAASELDYRPSRLALLSSAAHSFLPSFFDGNPLSHAAVLLLRDGIAKPLTELTAAPDAHVAAVKAGAGKAAGAMSLQNCLDAALDILAPVPAYGLRELLLLSASLSSCDPGDLLAAMRRAVTAGLRCSVVGMAAEMHVCRQLADMTGGRYDVALNEAHFHSLVARHCPPPPVPPHQVAASLVRMAFPQRSADGSPVLCSCHGELKLGGTFVCPRCKAHMCSLPADCRVCGTTLVSSPHLARSYHHLFPVPPFVEVPLRAGRVAGDAAGEGGQGAREDLPASCFSCLAPLPATEAEEGGMRLRCPLCLRHFCFACDAFIHESLHNCPGCESQPPPAPQSAQEPAQGP